MEIASFFMKYKWALVFYFLLALVFYLGRKNVVVQAKIIFLYRTVIGIPFIERVAEKYREWVKLFGYVGAGVGFIGMAIISILIFLSLIWLFTRPEQPPGVAPVYPGMEIPGLGVLSFWVFLISLFVIAVIHEFSHGIVSHAHGIKVRWTGIVLFGPILGAFVDPDDKKLARQSDIVQYSVYAAGAFSNIILAVLCSIVLSFVLIPVQDALVEPVGFSFAEYSGKGNPAELAGLLPGSVITSVNNKTIRSGSDFVQIMQCARANETLLLGTQAAMFTLKTTDHPDRPGYGFAGISFKGAKNEQKVKNPAHQVFNDILETIISFFRWLSLLSLGIGLANLLPLPIVDGGRMVQTLMKRLYGDEKGNGRYGKIAMAFLALLLVNLFIPLVRWILKQFS